MASDPNPVYIVDALRIPVGKRYGRYKTVLPEHFTADLLQSLLARNEEAATALTEILLATAVGTGGNMARYIALKAGIDASVPASTLDAQCVGSYKAIEVGFALIKSGRAAVVVVGGMESSSLSPTRTYHANDERYQNNPYGYATFAPPEFGDTSLTGTAAATAERLQISKKDMVAWTIRSNERALEAHQAGILNKYVCAGANAPTWDETIRDAEIIRRYAGRYEATLIDASTSCQHTDGAGLLLLCSAQAKREFGLSPEFFISDSASTASPVRETPVAFEKAISTLLKNNNLPVAAIDLFEINESFALMPVHFQRNFGVDDIGINSLGGNLAYGHPFGASGAINLIHLLASMKHLDKSLGIVAASAAGGLGNALLIQRV